MSVTDAMTKADVLRLAENNPTVDVRTACHALGFGTNLGYVLIKRGDFPCRVLKIGRKLRVPTADLLEVLGY